MNALVLNAPAGMASALPRPSSLPMLAQCPCFSSTGSDDAESGKDRHEYLSRLWRLDSKGLDFAETGELFELESRFTKADQEGVLWAFEQIKLKAPLLDYEMDFERRLVIFDENFREVWGGTPDAVCGSHVFDMKWRERDYTAQMAAYAILIFDETDWQELTFHILYACAQRVQTIKFTRESAVAIVAPIIARAQDPDRLPVTCDYCGWCSKRLTCPAFNAPAIAVASGREDWAMQTYHVTEITSPDDMAMALRLVPLLRKWCDAVDFYKRDWAIKQGIKIPGYTVRSEKGDREITDLNQALALSGIPPEEFIKICKVGIGDLKKLWAAHYMISEKAADKEINQKLAAVIAREPVEKVVKEKETTHGNE